jgi:uncharacterized metal-binding protein YceD (DUF177 family)
MTAEPPAPHGFRRVVPTKVSETGLVHKIEAKPAEYEQIAQYLDLVALRGLKAELLLSPWRGKGLRITGKMAADVTQSCVVTLDPVEAHVEVEFERRFMQPETPGREHAEQHEVFVDPEGEDPAEPLGREVDLGEILIEELALNLDPYPRKPDAEFKDGEPGAPRETPFAGLAKLKAKMAKKEG